MTSKIIIAGLVAIAFVAGTIMTDSAVFADKKDDKNGNQGIIAALTAIADAITGIDPNVTVPPAEVQIIGIDGPAGPPGQDGADGLAGQDGADGLVITIDMWYQNTRTDSITPLLGGQHRVDCREGDIAMGGGYSYSGDQLIITGSHVVEGNAVVQGHSIEYSNPSGTNTYSLSVFTNCLDITP